MINIIFVVSVNWFVPYYFRRIWANQGADVCCVLHTVYMWHHKIICMYRFFWMRMLAKNRYIIQIVLDIPCALEDDCTIIFDS